MFYLISLFWLTRETKAVLFWLYLWQLKEYHIGRFFAHFSTTIGKQLLCNKLLIFKLLLAIILLYGFYLFGFEILPPPIFSTNFFLFFFEFFVRIPFLVLILYIFEAVHASFNFFQKKLKKPVLTKKTVFLISTALVLEVLFIVALSLYFRDEWGYINFIPATFYLLLFDILTPSIVSAIVLLFQPITVLLRNRIIEKAKRKREQLKNLLVIGITGSYGKTSTKEFLATILAEKFNVLKTKEHQNSEVGVSQCILNDLKPEHEIFICEMGAYNRGGIKLLCDITKPKIGVITGINEQHLSTFGSQENIISGKYELIESLPEDSLAIFNGDNEYCFELYKKTLIKKRVYSLQSSISGLPSDIWAAKALARELGMSEKEIARACQRIKNKFPGIQIKKGIDNLNIIDATYSANPDGVLAHLEYLKSWPGKKIIVMPCLIELGKASKEVHKRIGKKIAEVCDLAIITTKECFENIKIGVNLQRVAPCKILFLGNPKEIFEKIKNFTKEGDIVLLESRLPDQLIQQLTIDPEG